MTRRAALAWVLAAWAAWAGPASGAGEAPGAAPGAPGAALSLRAAPLRDALDALKEKLGLRYVAPDDVLRSAKPVTLEGEFAREEALAEIARQAGVSVSTGADGVVAVAAGADDGFGPPAAGLRLSLACPTEPFRYGARFPMTVLLRNQEAGARSIEGMPACGGLERCDTLSFRVRRSDGREVRVGNAYGDNEGVHPHPPLAVAGGATLIGTVDLGELAAASGALFDLLSEADSVRVVVSVEALQLSSAEAQVAVVPVPRPAPAPAPAPAPIPVTPAKQLEEKLRLERLEQAGKPGGGAAAPSGPEAAWIRFWRFDTRYSAFVDVDRDGAVFAAIDEGGALAIRAGRIPGDRAARFLDAAATPAVLAVRDWEQEEAERKGIVVELLDSPDLYVGLDVQAGGRIRSAGSAPIKNHPEAFRRMAEELLAEARAMEPAAGVLALLEAEVVPRPRAESIRSDPRRFYRFLPMDARRLGSDPSLERAIRHPRRRIPVTDASELSRLEGFLKESNVQASARDSFVSAAGHDYQMTLTRIPKAPAPETPRPTGGER